MLNTYFKRAVKVYGSNFFPLLLASLILAVFSGITNQFDGIWRLALATFIGGPIVIGEINFSLGAYRSGKANIFNIFAYMTTSKKFIRAVLFSALVSAVTFLMFAVATFSAILSNGSKLLLILSVVLGVFLLCCLGLTYYLFCNDDTISMFKCISLSFELMSRNFFRLVGLNFILYVTPVVLCVLIFIFSPILLTMILFPCFILYSPFVCLVLAGFYDDILLAYTNNPTIIESCDSFPTEGTPLANS